MYELPKISCLLVTASGRFNLVIKSIQCYISQTYPNKELLIVNEGPRDYQQIIENYVNQLGRSDIRLVWLNGKYTLGSLRNISILLAEGEIVVQWDDDDFSLPGRLMTQYAYLIKNNAKVCYMTDQLHYYYSSNELYWDSWIKYHSGNTKRYSLIPGTCMMYRDLDVKYPWTCAGEDTEFANKLIGKYNRQVILLENYGFMHMYTCHGSNQVYDYEHHVNISRVRSNDILFMRKNRSKIIRSINSFQLEGLVKVMGRDGLAFTYENKYD